MGVTLRSGKELKKKEKEKKKIEKEKHTGIGEEIKQYNYEVIEEEITIEVQQ